MFEDSPRKIGNVVMERKNANAISSLIEKSKETNLFGNIVI
jgi:hypothetical protein